MITYLIKSILCSGLLLGVYYLFLEKEKMHRFNRFYLLAAFITSWFIPLITFKIKAPVITEKIQPIISSTIFTEQQSTAETVINTVSQPVYHNYLSMILWAIYAIVTLVLLIRFIMNLYRVRELIIKNLSKKQDRYSLVIVPNNTVSYSFFRYIFPAKDDYENGTMNEDIFLHESVHAKELHSMDILFTELAKIFLWINPFVFLYKRAIQLNHEFIADDIVVKENNVGNYQQLLLSKIIQTPLSQLVSSSNYSITKKRLIMMTKKTKRTKAILLKVTVIPILGIIIFGFADKVVADSVNQIDSTFHNDATPVSSFTFNDSDIVSSYKALYNSLIQKGQNEKGQETFKYNGSRAQFLKLENMYNSMTVSQKSQIDSLPLFIKIGLDNPNPYPKQLKPTEIQIKKWSAHPELWAIWYNEKRIKNSDLKNYNMNDFANYHAYNLTHENSLRQGFNVEIHIEDQANYNEEIKNYKKWNDTIQGGMTIIKSKTETVNKDSKTKSFTPPVVERKDY